jgi:SAM-dependent methyltransferase
MSPSLTEGRHQVSRLSALVADAAQWGREYEHARAIPSSHRTEPSRILKMFSPLLIPRGTTRIALDAGCGNGRNSVFLAELGYMVYAVDFQPAALALAEQNIRHSEFQDRVRVLEASLLKPLPSAVPQFDLVLDSYVSCHLVDPEQFRLYWSGISLMTKGDGTLLSSHFLPDDDYYKQFTFMLDGQQIATDPANGISKLLLTEFDARQRFSSMFDVDTSASIKFNDIVMGREYRRSLLALLMKMRR